MISVSLAGWWPWLISGLIFLWHWKLIGPG